MDNLDTLDSITLAAHAVRFRALAASSGASVDVSRSLLRAAADVEVEINDRRLGDTPSPVTGESASTQNDLESDAGDPQSVDGAVLTEAQEMVRDCSDSDFARQNKAWLLHACSAIGENDIPIGSTNDDLKKMIQPWRDANPLVEDAE